MTSQWQCSVFMTNREHLTQLTTSSCVNILSSVGLQHNPVSGFLSYSPGCTYPVFSVSSQPLLLECLKAQSLVVFSSLSFACSPQIVSLALFPLNFRLTYPSVYSTASLANFIGIVISVCPKLTSRSMPHASKAFSTRSWQLHPSSVSGPKPWNYWRLVSLTAHIQLIQKFIIQNLSLLTISTATVLVQITSSTCPDYWSPCFSPFPLSDYTRQSNQRNPLKCK